VDRLPSRATIYRSPPRTSRPLEERGWAHYELPIGRAGWRTGRRLGALHQPDSKWWANKTRHGAGVSVLLVFGSLLLPTSIPGRSASERLEHGLPFPFIQQKLMGYGFMAEGPSAYTGPALAPQEFPTELSEAALLADIVIVGVGLWLVGGLWRRRRRRSTSSGQADPGRSTA
jgi:hypothetical protein